MLTPNASLSPHHARLLVLALGAAMSLIALFFAAMGAWMVLPFSGAEWLALSLALWWAQRNGAVVETITIQERFVSVEVKHLASERSHRFERAWLRVERVCSARHGYPSRIFLCRQGARLEIGRFLIEAERDALARELRRFL